MIPGNQVFPAAETVRLVVEAFARTDVDEAKKPHVPFPLNHSGVVVDCCGVEPKLVSVVVKGHEPAPAPVASSPSQRSELPVIEAQVGIMLSPSVEEAEATPVLLVTRTPLGAEETVRLVVEAVPK